MKTLGRLAMKKVAMSIKIEFVQAQTAGIFKDQFIIGWKRGPQFDYSNQYKFVNTEALPMNDSFERISTFYTNKHNQYQTKTCEFKLITDNKKILQSVTIDMAKVAGMGETTTQIGFKNHGVIIDLKINIEVADKEKYKHLLVTNDQRGGPSVALRPDEEN